MADKENIAVKYVKESYAEFKKVTWPSKKEIKNHTLVVVFLSLALAAFLGLLDYIFTFGLNKLIIK